MRALQPLRSHVLLCDAATRDRKMDELTFLQKDFSRKNLRVSETSA